MTCSKADPGSAANAADVLARGGIAILPTDTVYGFSGVVDLRGRGSLRTDMRIRQVKGRGEEKPFIHLIPSPEDIRCYTDEAVPAALLALWPGALTVIVRTKPGSPLAVPAETVAFRCPGDAWLREVVVRAGAPLYSTSVNLSGSPFLGDVSEIERVFGESVDLIVTDGDRHGAFPSTIVSVLDGEVRVVRQGSVQVPRT